MIPAPKKIAPGAVGAEPSPAGAATSPIKHGAIPVSANRYLIGLITALSLLQFIVVPMALLPESSQFGWLLLVCVLATPTHWSVIHEAIHGHLSPERRSNDIWGRILSVFFGSPFQLLRFGHLMHHRFNRTPIQRFDVSAGAEQPKISENAWYFFIISIGLYIFEVAAAFFALLPNKPFKRLVNAAFGEQAPDGRSMALLAERHLVAEPGRSMLRLDGMLICILLAISFWLYGAYWWMLAAALLTRGVIVSVLDNIYHYGNKLDDTQAGYNLSLPAVLEKGMLYFNLHELHHKHPNKPWSELPKLLEDGGGVYHHSFWHAMTQQFRGLIPERIAAGGHRDLRRNPFQRSRFCRLSSCRARSLSGR